MCIRFSGMSLMCPSVGEVFLGSGVLERKEHMPAHPLLQGCHARWTPLPGHTVVLPVAVPRAQRRPAHPAPSLQET